MMLSCKQFFSAIKGRNKQNVTALSYSLSRDFKSSYSGNFKRVESDRRNRDESVHRAIVKNFKNYFTDFDDEQMRILTIEFPGVKKLLDYTIESES